MVFFTDRNLGSEFPGILKAAGLNVEKHDDHFPTDTSDEEWLVGIGRRGWFAISKDKNIRRKNNELSAVMNSGVGLFIVVGGEVRHRELAENFIDCENKIQRFLEKNSPPFIAKVYRPSPSRLQQGGRVELWLSYQNWQSGQLGRKTSRPQVKRS